MTHKSSLSPYRSNCLSPAEDCYHTDSKRFSVATAIEQMLQDESVASVWYGSRHRHSKVWGIVAVGEIRAKTSRIGHLIHDAGLAVTVSVGLWVELVHHARLRR